MASLLTLIYLKPILLINTKDSLCAALEHSYQLLNCFDLCDILRTKLTTYSQTINAHMMNDDSGDFFGCICKN